MAKKKNIPEINASSQADIAFTVLIFFLVVSTMDIDTGIVRMLPPMADPNVKQEDIKVKERNLLLVFVSGSGNIMAGGKVISLNALKDKAKEFILNPLDDKDLPEKKVTDIEMPDGSKWAYPVSEGVISLQNTRDTSYQVYIQVQNELTRAFNEVRDEVSMSKFGKKFEDLDEAERKVITKAIPMKISEAEPRKMAKSSMAVMKKKGEREVPAMSTTSLPDVVYIILFFFMLSTSMRDQELLVTYKLPEATEVQKLEKKNLVSYIHVGVPSLNMQAKFGTAPRIQLNDSYKTTKDILDFIAGERDNLNESDRASMTVCLKADENTKMGVVADVKQELRRANALKLSYASSKVLNY